MQPANVENKPESPALINAFQLISMSSSLDLSGFFESEVSIRDIMVILYKFTSFVLNIS